MGCVSSVFQFGSYLVHEGAEVGEEQKDEPTSEKDEELAPSSPSQNAEVTATSGGSDKLQETPSKIEAPLAVEEEVFSQNASPVAEEVKEEAKQAEEAQSTEAPEPEVKELQRVNETKLEKEKTVDDAGVTTEKTVYTQVSENVTIQERKGPVLVDPFATSEKTVFPPFSKSWYDIKPKKTESQSSPSYVHSVKITDSSPSTPASPISVSSEVSTPEKSQPVPESPENISVPEKLEVITKFEEIEMASEAIESPVDQPVLEKPELTSSPQHEPEEEQTMENEEETREESEVISELEEQTEEDSEETNVEGAVVKIQAGIRGYLTRKALKESRKDGPLMQSEKAEASEPQSDEGTTLAEVEAQELNTEDLIKDQGEENAAVKIQAVYRGYRTRKQLDELLSEPCDQEVEALNVIAQNVDSVVQEIRKSPLDRSPVTVTENFVPIFKAQVTITPPSSPTIKKQSDSVPSSPTMEPPKEAPTSEISEKDPSGDAEVPDSSKTEDEEQVPDDEEDEASKKHAATKIQAAFRGYQVRKTSKKEDPEKVKENLDETTDRCISSDVVEDAQFPALETENDVDLLGDEVDDDEEIPDVEWQTSELYVDESNPKCLQEHESKTESAADKGGTPESDTSKTSQVSTKKITLSPTKVTPEESQSGDVPSNVEG